MDNNEEVSSTVINGLQRIGGEPEDEDYLSELNNDKDKYQLLDRLFKFIDTKETPLNPVLSGYF